VKPSKSDINAVIMDYLLSEGYPDAAQKFASEANIDPQPNTETIEARVAIRNAILAGNIEAAIERINDVNPEILDTDAQLHFSLLRLQLIEIIRRGDKNSKDDLLAAVHFANKQLAPRAKGHPQFIEDLERGMALLIFPSESLPPALKTLLDPSLRLSLATQVNRAILHNQGEQTEAQIRDLVKLRQWAEQKCRETKKSIPPTLSLGLDQIDDMDDQDGNETTNGNSAADADAMVH